MKIKRAIPKPQRPQKPHASRILYTWELGGDYGHIGNFLPVALKLRERGHEVLFAIKDLSNAETVLGRHGFRWFQAPVWLPSVQGLPKPPLSYTEILWRFGFLQKPGLTSMVKGWRELYATLKPDLLIADHAPTALLAAQGLSLKRALFGTGFCSPPRVAPMPNMRAWLKVPEQRLANGERAVVQVANSVLADLGAAPLKAVADLFNVDEDFLCTFPELDHFPNRGPVRYWGCVFSVDQGQDLPWAEGPAKRVFAYVKPQYRDFEKVLAALQASEAAALVFVPGIARNVAQKYSSPKMTVTTQPIRLAGLIPRCDLAICHAGHGTLGAMLLAGVPLLLLPTQLEQLLASSRVAATGAGAYVQPKKNQALDYRAILTHMLATPKFAEQAKAFAAKHADFTQAGQCEAMARRVEEILRGRPEKS